MKGGREAGEPREPSADEMTPGELTNRQMGKKTREDGEQQTQFLYLSTSESEESLSSDLEAEGQQERGRVGRGNGVKHTQERQEGYRTRVKGSKERLEKHFLKMSGRLANRKEEPGQSHKAACPEAVCLEKSFTNRKRERCCWTCRIL